MRFHLGSGLLRAPDADADDAAAALEVGDQAVGHGAEEEEHNDYPHGSELTTFFKHCKRLNNIAWSRR